VTQPASGLPSASLPAEARAALAARADPATGRFAGSSSIAALLFLLDRARDGDEEAARLALSVLRRTPDDERSAIHSRVARGGLGGAPLAPPSSMDERSAIDSRVAADAAVHVEAFDVRRDDGLEKTARAALDAALKAFGWNDHEEEGGVGTDAHGLMIATLSRGSVVLDAPGYREAASRAGERALDRRVDVKWGTLLHLGGEAKRAAGLGDYALLVHGLLELLAATGEKGWLHEAVRLQGEQEEHLGDVREGGYFESPEGAGRMAKKHGSDGSFLSGNGIAALNLIHLSRLTGERSYRDRAEGVLRAFAPEITQAPLAHLTLLQAAQRFERASSAG